MFQKENTTEVLGHVIKTLNCKGIYLKCEEIETKYLQNRIEKENKINISCSDVFIFNISRFYFQFNILGIQPLSLIL